jgi:hypothetical protein
MGMVFGFAKEIGDVKAHASGASDVKLSEPKKENRKKKEERTRKERRRKKKKGKWRQATYRPAYERIYCPPNIKPIISLIHAQ